MELNKETSSAKYQIQSYDESGVVINAQLYTNSIILMPHYLAPWHVTSIDKLQSHDLVELKDLKPEIILLGTGSTLVFPEQAITKAIIPYKIGLEVMTTAAACRTFTALAAERRNILAALII